MRGVIRMVPFAAAALLLAACGPTSAPGPVPASDTTVSAPSNPVEPTTRVESDGVPVLVYFGHSGFPLDCADVVPATRSVPAGIDRLVGALEQLLGGPTAAESAAGYYSWFSAETEGLLLGAATEGLTTYVNLDARIVDAIDSNVTTSCGMLSLLAALDTTVIRASGVPDVIYAIDGNPRAFYSWLGLVCPDDDVCDPTPFENLG